MHIPDGFLSTPVWLTTAAASAPAIAIAARKAQKDVEETSIPMLGVMGAFVFAAQMINFPVGVGTSGHLVGSALLAVTLGPAAATVAMTAILAIQALVFQDGGVLALGANVFNMAVIGVMAGYMPYHYWGETRFRKGAIFLGGAAALGAGAILAIAELVLSGVPMPGPALGLSLGLFLVAAILEGAITVAVVQGIEKLKPAAFHGPQDVPAPLFRTLALSAVLLAGVGVLFASTYPDGLEALSEQIGLASRARTLFATPVSDYEAAFFESPWLRKAAAGVFGLALVWGACLLFGRVAANNKRSA